LPVMNKIVFIEYLEASFGARVLTYFYVRCGSAHRVIALLFSLKIILEV